jgi:hypothetical protein
VHVRDLALGSWLAFDPRAVLSGLDQAIFVRAGVLQPVMRALRAGVFLERLPQWEVREYRWRTFVPDRGGGLSARWIGSAGRGAARGWASMTAGGCAVKPGAQGPRAEC